MKKFLKLGDSLRQQEVPRELDIPILAAAAMRAKHFRNRRIMLKIVFPGAATAVAAAAVMLMMPGTVISAGQHETVSSARTIAAVRPKPARPDVPQEKLTAPVDLLALADTSTLEQECYNLSTMADFSFDSESFII